MSFLPKTTVGQIRLGLATIVFLVVALVFVSLFALSRIEAAKDGLVENALPRLESAQFVSGEIAQLMFNIRSIKSTESVEKLDQLAAGIEQDFRNLSEGATLSDDLTSNLVEIKSSATKAIQTAKRVFELEEKKRMQLAQIAVINREASEISRELAESASEAIERDLVATPTGDEDDRNLLGAQIYFNTVMIEMGLSLENLAVVADRAAVSNRLDTLEAIEQNIAFRFRGLVRQAVSIPDPSVKRRVATKIRELRTILLDEGGLIEGQRELIEIAGEQENLRNQDEDILDRLTGGMNALLKRAETDIVNETRAVNSAVQSTNSTVLATGFLSLAVMAIVVFVVVERRIIGRLASLTNSVREIANGNANHVVSVSGKDELAEMAAALNVFKKNSSELLRSNRELERFAYAASHDLRSPLNAISNLAQWTIEDAGDILPEDCRENLDSILNQTNRLGALMTSLLDYAQIGREDGHVRKVNIAGIADDALKLLARNDHFSLMVSGDSIEVVTYEAPLRQVMLNLISNAVKHHDKGEGEIRIEANRVGDRLQIRVRDDGPGVPVQFHERIFGLFQLLRPRDEVEGSGMGLSIIKRLVEHYGGKIEVLSDPEQERGCAFVFDWPILNERAALPAQSEEISA